jgi:hypothetical protein
MSSDSQSGAESPTRTTIEEVKQDAAKSMKTTAEYTQQQHDKLVAELKAQLAGMDAKIETLREKGKELGSESRASWDKKMSDLEIKRKAAVERLSEVESATEKAWSDLAKGVQSAFEELKVAYQNAADEF